jgi:hypothetical protein
MVSEIFLIFGLDIISENMPWRVVLSHPSGKLRLRAKRSSRYRLLVWAYFDIKWVLDAPRTADECLAYLRKNHPIKSSEA